jgi:demethylmenaquinone methyltransferase/2-methoxy-6-polyprenyl-1,4-benzoquinol methylase
MGFSMRNVVDIDATLREIRRVLRPGARFVNLDMSKAPNPLWKGCFDLYFYHVVPLVGGLIGGSRAAYTYLPQSLTHHPNAEALRERFNAAGFTNTGFVRLMGGAIAIHYGSAP